MSNDSEVMDDLNGLYFCPSCGQELFNQEKLERAFAGTKAWLYIDGESEMFVEECPSCSSEIAYHRKPMYSYSLSIIKRGDHVGGST